MKKLQLACCVHCQLDAVLFCKYSAIPNQVKPGSCFSCYSGLIVARKDIFAIDDFSENPIDHITAGKAGKAVCVRPEYREVPAAHLAGERTWTAFLFLSFSKS